MSVSFSEIKPGFNSSKQHMPQVMCCSKLFLKKLRRTLFIGFVLQCLNKSQWLAKLNI